MSMHNRGTPYYKNYKTTNKNDGGAAMTIGNATISALYNPFTIKTTQPKWPDGLATYSVGVRNVDVRVVGTNSVQKDGVELCPNAIGSKEFLIWLNPSISNFCVIFARQQVGTEITFNCLSVDSISLKHPLSTGNVELIEPIETFNSWRPVSYAIKIKPIKTAFETDSWFECIRTNRNSYFDRIAMLVMNDDEVIGSTGVEIGNNEIAKTGFHLPTDELLSEWFETKLWYTNPSYSSGKMHHLPDIMFQLNNEKNNNDFTRIDRVYYDKGNVDVVPKLSADYKLVVPKDGVSSTVHSGDNSEAFNEGPYMSNTMDSVLIKIHAKQNTRFIIHGIANVEYLVSEDSPTNMYVSPSYPAIQALERYLDNRNKFHKKPWHMLRHNNVQYENDDYN